MDSDYDLDYYGDDDYGAEEYDNGNNDEEDDGMVEDMEVGKKSDNPFTVLEESDICRRQEEDINKVLSVIQVTKSEATMLLRHYKWNVSAVHEEWFADEEKVRKDTGLLIEPAVQYSNALKIRCGICFGKCLVDRIDSAVCGHPYCVTCWSRYIEIAIEDGPGCLLLRCPESSCTAFIGEDMIDRFASDDNKKKYSRYSIRTYIEDKRKFKWCPAPDCIYAVEFDYSVQNYDATCLCSHPFCWSCLEDAHRPVDCDTVSKWIIKNSAESENTTWILANSKPCPKCKRPIEKNQGCMHMTCGQSCRFEFCWLCLGDWKQHGANAGGFYACNRYEAAKQDGKWDEEEKLRERAKMSLERYSHYYERWTGNEKSRQKAIVDSKRTKDEDLKKLSVVQDIPETDLCFIVEAWEQIIECRRVLKWTYAYGYYIPEDEHAKKQLFEYLQGEAESGLERLHQCAEKELKGFMVVSNYAKGAPPQQDLVKFSDFRSKLANLTRVTGIYFDNLVNAFENGLSDVDPCAVAPSSTSSSSKKRKNREK